MYRFNHQQLSVNSGDLINPDTEVLHHGDGEMGGAQGVGQEEVDHNCCDTPTSVKFEPCQANKRLNAYTD